MKELHSYLNDHLADSVSALELIAHSVDVQKGKPLGAFFAETEREIKADQDVLRDVMRSRGLAAANLPELNTYDFEELQRRAEQQIERIEAERIRALPEAFAGRNSSQ